MTVWEECVAIVLLVTGGGDQLSGELDLVCVIGGE